ARARWVPEPSPPVPPTLPAGSPSPARAHGALTLTLNHVRTHTDHGHGHGHARSQSGKVPDLWGGLAMAWQWARAGTLGHTIAHHVLATSCLWASMCPASVLPAGLT